VLDVFVHVFIERTETIDPAAVNAFAIDPEMHRESSDFHVRILNDPACSIKNHTTVFFRCTRERFLEEIALPLLAQSR